jgi:hypothetical protein
MGLDFRWPSRQAQLAPTWSYSGFHEFRHKVAAAAGMGSLDDYIGFGGKKPFPSVDDEPIVELLNHSDCEGDLSPEQCNAIGPRLRDLIAAWPGDDYDRMMGERLAAACDACAESGVPLEFC